MRNEKQSITSQASRLLCALCLLATALPGWCQTSTYHYLDMGAYAATPAQQNAFKGGTMLGPQTNLSSLIVTNDGTGQGVNITASGITLSGGATIPNGGSGSNVSQMPALTWTNVPAFADNFASGTFTNWGVTSGGQTIFSISSTNTLVCNGTNASAFSNIIAYSNYFTAAENWTAHFQFYFVGTGLATSGINGLGFGIFATNLNKDNSMFAEMALDNTVGVGRMFFFSRVNSSGPMSATWAGSSGPSNALSASPGQWIDITLKKRDYNFTVIASNTAAFAPTNVAYMTGTAISAGNSFTNLSYPSTGNFAFWSVGGTNVITNLTFTIDAFVDSSGRVPILLEGDSITVGFGSTDFAFSSYADYLQAKLGYGVYVDAGRGDTTVQLMQRLPEVQKLNPRKVVIMVGGNDITQGYPFSQYSTNLQYLFTNQASATAYIATYTPWTTQDNSPLALFVATNFPLGSVVDTFNPLTFQSSVSSDSHSLDLQYNSGDGIHPNTKGHSVIGRQILTALLGQ